MISAIRSSCPAPPDMPAPDRLRARTKRCCRTTTGSSAASTCCASISCSRASSSASSSTEPRNGAAAAARRRRSTSSSPSTRSNPRLPAAVQAAMFALYAAPAVNLFEMTTRPHSGQARTSTNTTSCRTAAATSTSSRTACSTSSPIIPAVARRCRSAALFSAAETRRADAALLHGPPPAAPAHRRGAALRRGLGLYRHRHVHLARRAGGHRRRGRASPSSACARCARTAT